MPAYAGIKNVAIESHICARKPLFSMENGGNEYSMLEMVNMIMDTKNLNVRNKDIPNPKI